MRKPNLFIVGVPKSGSTSLHNYLNKHPDICMSKTKEPNYFSSEEIKKQNLYYKDAPLINDIKEYNSIFEYTKDEKIIGESSVSYLFYSNISKKIHDFNSESKIIILLRNPIERSFSHYLMDFTSGYFNYEFNEVIKKDFKSKEPIIYQQIIELSLYYNQIKTYYEIFNKKNILILFQEDLNKNSNSTLNKIYDFLEVEKQLDKNNQVNKKLHTYKEPRNILVNYLYKQQKIKSLLRNILSTSLKNKFKNILVKEAIKPKMSNFEKDYLQSFFKDDVKKLSNLINIDCSKKWSNFND